MRNNYILYFFICFLLFCGKAYSKVWIPIGSQEQGDCLTMTVLRNDASSYQVEVIINGLYDEQITNDYGTFHSLSLGTCGMSLISGEPALPLISRLIAIPTGKVASSSVIEEQWTDVEIGTILPSQIPSNESKKKAPFYMDNKAYRKPFLPAIVSQMEEQTWCGIRNVGISVCPFRYDCSDNKLSVLSKFLIRVNFEPVEDLQREDSSYEETDGVGLFDNTVYTLSNSSIRTSNSNNKLLIILGKNLNIANSAQLEEFRRWKALKGFDTKVASLDTILSTEFYLQDEVKEFIRNEVGSGGSVLLVGDHSKIPMATISGYYNYQTIYGDYWYGCGTGTNDWQADISIGRFSVNSLWQFEQMAKKTIKYESSRPFDSRTLLVADDKDPDDFFSAQNFSELIRDRNYSTPMSFISAFGAEGATNADVVSSLNFGVPIACYLGYGFPNYWGGSGTEFGPDDPYCGWNNNGESFYGSEATNLNDSARAIMFSICPYSANIMNAGNMLESFTRNHKGLTAFTGYTTDNYAFVDQGDTFAYYLFEHLLNNQLYHLGDLTNAAYLTNVTSYYGAALAKDFCFSYICGGDPTLELWTGAPHSFGNVSLIENNSSITLNTEYSGDYEVCVSSESGNLLGVYPVFSGNTCTFLRPSGNFYIGINKHNYIPHIIKYDVSTDAVQNETISIDTYYHKTPIGLGDGVTVDLPDGPVIVDKDTKLVIQNGSGGVLFEAGFECKKGGFMEIKQ